MKIKENYIDEFLALRYGLLTNSDDYQTKKSAYQNLISKCNEIGWYAFPGDLRDRKEGIIGSMLSTLLDPIKNGAQATKNYNSKEYFFFENLTSKEVPNKIDEIMEKELTLYKTGNFRLFNLYFTLHIKNLKNANEDDMNALAVYYFISSALRGNENPYMNDINTVSAFYTLYDYNIYIFLMKFLLGSFKDLSQQILKIKQNLSELTYSLVDEEDLAFYCSLSLLVDYNYEYLKQMLVDNESLVYKLNEKYPQYFTYLKQYQRANFDVVIDYFISIRSKLESDSFTFNNYNSMLELLKKNILNEVIKNSAAVKLSYLADLLKIYDNTILENWIFELHENNPNIVIDDIDKIVYLKPKDLLEDTISQSIDNGRKIIAEYLKNHLKRPKTIIAELYNYCQKMSHEELLEDVDL